MEPLKPRDKVTQHMTRDGLTLDNQTTGESVNVSSREAEQEYTAQPEGAAEKILERADELHDRHKAKKAAKDAGETVAQTTGPVSRLQFTAEERASPELAPYIKKAEKRADKLEAAKEALPKKRVVTKETVYDEAKGKAKSRLYFDKVEKAPPQLKPNPASRPIQEAGLYLHGKIHEVEHENVGVEGGHKGEELAERQAGRMIRSGVHRHKLKPYRAAAKAERKSIAANAEFAYQKSLRDNPELAQAAKNPVSRFWQKQHIKREYAKAARAASQTAQGAASTAKTTASAAKKAAEKSRQAASFAARHWKGALIVGGVGLMLLLVMGGLQSCTAMFGSTGTGLAATSYLSEDSDMLGAEAAYVALEADLQHELDNYESLHPGYDEYRFDLDEIGHDPYVLTSILSALHEGVYTLGDVQGDLAMLFEKQYTLTQTIETETRYRTETRTDSEGNTYTVQVPYTYYICNVKLENFDMSHLPVYIMGEEQMSLYAVYMHTLGNRPDLFPNGTYPNASTVKEPTYYDIPPEALEDATFAAMMAEAEKYVGYPQHFRHVAAEAVEADNIILHYEKGDREQPASLYFDGRPDPKLGAFLRYEAKPNEPEHLRELLRQEQKGRAQLAPGDFKAHITALHDGMILAEAQRIVAGLKDLSAPNSPNKTHFMVELSPYFVQIASSKDTDRLFSMLPYKSLCFTGMKDRHGLYAVIGKDENRDKEVRRPRASIRRQLSETKQAQAPKKAPARTKKNELEV